MRQNGTRSPPPSPGSVVLINHFNDAGTIILYDASHRTERKHTEG
jgi:hypothetical protein